MIKVPKTLPGILAVSLSLLHPRLALTDARKARKTGVAVFDV
jgi:hypothetical protein